MTAFPVIYIPVINDKVFLHKPIGWEVALAIGFSVLFFLGAEAWKWAKRIYGRKHSAKARNPEYELERDDPFQKYASFSRSNTMDMQQVLV